MRASMYWLPKERKINVYPGKYEAWDTGHICCFSKAKVNANKPYPFQLEETLGSNGYLSVTLIEEGGKRITVSVHSLINRAYNGPKPSPNHVTRHLDGDKTNNHPNNLCWGTYAENEADKRRHGTVACGERQGSAKLTEEAVRIIRASIPCGLWDTTSAAKVFGVEPVTIRQIARGESWKHVK